MQRREPIRRDPATGRYVVVVDVAAPGERRKQLKRRFSTYRDARRWLTATRADLARGTFTAPHPITLAEWVEEAWLPALRHQVRPSTYASYARNLRLHVLPDLGSRRLQALRPSDLTALYGRLLDAGRADHRAGAGLSHRSVAYVATITGRCLADAVADGRLATSPTAGARVPRPSSAARLHAAMPTWTREQLARFLAAGRGHRHYPAWLTLATTGCRRGEVLGLPWSSLDLAAGRLTVRRTLVDLRGGDPVWSDPKTASGRRSIALDPGTVDVLEALRRAQAAERRALGSGYAGQHDLVFCRPDGRPYHPDRFTRTFGAQAQRLGLPPLSVHGLRHTWATLALQAGVHPKVVSERLGHANIGITLQVYSHVVPAMDTEAADLVADLILGAAGDP